MLGEVETKTLIKQPVMLKIFPPEIIKIC